MAKENKAGRMKVLGAFLLLFGPAVLLIFISTRGCEHKFKELDDYGVVESFQFKTADGKTHNSSELEDKVLLVNTIQQTCPHDCAISQWHFDQMIFQKMRKNKSEKNAVRIISFVTDQEGNPIDDIASVQNMLKEEVEDYDPEIWMVVSGDVESLYDRENNGESLLKEGDEFYGGKAYTELILLIDRDSHLRMVHPGKMEGHVRRLYQHVALLLKEYDKKDAKSN